MGALINKLSGDPWQRYATLRLLYGYQRALPGKKLPFMGGELGAWNEWNHDAFGTGEDAPRPLRSREQSLPHALERSGQPVGDELLLRDGAGRSGPLLGRPGAKKNRTPPSRADGCTKRPPIERGDTTRRMAAPAAVVLQAPWSRRTGSFAWGARALGRPCRLLQHGREDNGQVRPRQRGGRGAV